MPPLVLTSRKKGRKDFFSSIRTAAAAGLATAAVALRASGAATGARGVAAQPSTDAASAPTSSRALETAICSLFLGTSAAEILEIVATTARWAWLAAGRRRREGACAA